MAAALAPGGTADPEVIDMLSQLFEERLGGMMLVRLGLTELVERFKQEEHALAMSLKTILQLRDRERVAFRAQLEEANAYARQLEAQLHEARRFVGARADRPLPPDGADGHGQALPSVEAVAARLIVDEATAQAGDSAAQLAIGHGADHDAEAAVVRGAPVDRICGRPWAVLLQAKRPARGRCHAARAGK